MRHEDRRDGPLQDEELLANVAEARFTLRDGESFPVPLETLRIEFKLANTTLVSRAVRLAFERGLVRVARTANAKKRAVDRDADLEQRLLDRFDKLEDAIVVRCDDLESARAGEESAARINDEIHRRLGLAMAQYMRNGRFFRNGERIGVGSGRAVFYAIDFFSKLHKVGARNVEIMSLTGATYPTDHERKTNVLMDADLNVARLGVCFSRPVKLQQVTYPLINERHMVEETIGFTPLAAERWNQDSKSNRIPTVAIVGMGVLREGHQLFADLEASGRAKDTRSKLRTLTELCARIGGEPVGDICNRLLVVPDPARDKRTQRSLETLVDTINGGLFNVSHEQLALIPNLALVAGDVSKVRPIQALLEDRFAHRYNVFLLCTDRATATAILSDSKWP
ncbi:MAG: hypothetical protein RIT81_18005 [Deltaproteobacteria bacterium]